MELYQLKTFVQVAEEGNLTRASERLFTSQPAISAQIKALEEELKVTLFHRSARGMKLTDAGQRLLEQALETLASAESLRQQAKTLQQELLGEPSIGVHTDFDYARVGRLYQSIASAHPQIRPHFIQSMSPVILTDIRRGQLDGGFFFGDHAFGDLHVVEVAQTPMRVVGPAAWAERLHTASQHDLGGMPWVYTTRNCPFLPLSQQVIGDRKPAKAAYVDSEDAVRTLVSSGAGLSLLREDDAQRQEEAGLMSLWPGEAPTIALRFAVLAKRRREPVIAAVLEKLSDVWGLDVKHSTVERASGQ